MRGEAGGGGRRRKKDKGSKIFCGKGLFYNILSELVKSGSANIIESNVFSTAENKIYNAV